MIKLVAVDIDGTFMRNNYTYDEERFEKIFSRMKAAGCNFVAASGNQYYQLRKIFSKHADEISYVSENGALVRDRGELVFAENVPKSAVELVAKIFRRHKKMDGLMFGLKGAYCEIGAFGDERFELLKKYVPVLEWTKDFSEVEDQILKFAALMDKEDTEDCYKILREEVGGALTVVSSGFGAVDLLAHGCHKAAGLKKLVERWGISPEECAAFGDSENDIEMLRYCGESYAMENAPQFVKDAAKHVCPSNEEDGVLETLDKIFS